ncbi:hypothetical protein TNCV_3940701 [Trichonephila clavipes]|uniref:Transposase n=1 Tax=Trichonephila clavipes TaxID=2585209 RepID=A0A8X7B9W0_TRICX|nr:hypothetical protein TNCV_3940701 [Trichonephila clavipes]
MCEEWGNSSVRFKITSESWQLHGHALIRCICGHDLRNLITIAAVVIKFQQHEPVTSAVRLRQRGATIRCLWSEGVKDAEIHYKYFSLFGLGFETLEHPPYRPDLTPSYFHPFEQKQMKSRRFVLDRDARDAAQKWLHDQPKIFPIY